MKDTESVFSPSDHVAFRKIEGRMVLVDPLDRRMVTLNETGTVIWECLDGRNVGAIIRTLTELFETSEDQARSDVLDFLRQMEEQRFVVYSPGTEKK